MAIQVNNQRGDRQRQQRENRNNQSEKQEILRRLAEFFSTLTTNAAEALEVPRRRTSALALADAVRTAHPELQPGVTSASVRLTLVVTALLVMMPAAWFMDIFFARDAIKALVGNFLGPNWTMFAVFTIPAAWLVIEAVAGHFSFDAWARWRSDEPGQSAIILTFWTTVAVVAPVVLPAAAFAYTSANPDPNKSVHYGLLAFITGSSLVCHVVTVLAAGHLGEAVDYFRPAWKLRGAERAASGAEEDLAELRQETLEVVNDYQQYTLEVTGRGFVFRANADPDSPREVQAPHPLAPVAAEWVFDTTGVWLGPGPALQRPRRGTGGMGTDGLATDPPADLSPARQPAGPPPARPPAEGELAEPEEVELAARRGRGEP